MESLLVNGDVVPGRMVVAIGVGVDKVLRMMEVVCKGVLDITALKHST